MTGEATVETTARDTEVLAQSTLFAGLDEAERAAILGRAEPVRFTAGTPIFARGDPADGLYVLQSGGVTLSFFTSDGREFSFAFASVGAVFGEIAALDGGTRSGDAAALTDMSALKLSSEALRETLAASPRFADAVIRFLCARVRDTDQKLEAIALQSVEARLARFLVSAVRAKTRGSAREQDKHKVAITLSISPSELSLLIGESRIQVGAALALLEKAGAFHREGSQVVCDMAVLLRIADQGWD